MAPRIGILGARRVRQGLGPYLATHVEQAGGHVCAFACSRWSSVEVAAAELQERLGHGVTGYKGLDAMLSDANLDALIVASPIDTHEDALLGALDAGAHVLCEKPLIRPQRGATGRVETLLDAFELRGLELWENVQWPFTLPQYFKLYPATATEPVESFWMQLAPGSKGIDAVIDTLSHPLSVLQHLVPDPDPVLHSADIEILTEDGASLDVRFVYDAGSRSVPCLVELRHCPEPPRPAGYGINDRRVQRHIEMPSYRFRFEAPHESIDVPDPLAGLVVAFIERLGGGPVPELEVSVSARMRMLESFVA